MLGEGTWKNVTTTELSARYPAAGPATCRPCTAEGSVFFRGQRHIIFTKSEGWSYPHGFLGLCSGLARPIRSVTDMEIKDQNGKDPNKNS